MFSRRIMPLLVAVLLLVSCCALSGCGEKPVKSVVLMIGDGMGFNHIQNAEKFFDTQLNMNTKMQFSGEISTFSADNLITDSAAAATALSSGYKTKNSTIGYTYDDNDKLQQVQNMCELARSQGKAIGLVTTDSIYGATPGGFSVHNADRSDKEGITRDILKLAPEVLMAGYDAVAEQYISSKAYDKIVRSTAQLNKVDLAVTDRLLGLFDKQRLKSLNTNISPSIQQMTEAAMQILSHNEKGYFLMVEGGLIDTFSHNNMYEDAMSQLLEFDRAVGSAVDIAKAAADTLVVCTADHETGGLQPYEKDVMDTAYTSDGHTGVMVPLFSFGPHADQFGATLDNTDVAKKVAALLGAEQFGDADGFKRPEQENTDSGAINGDNYTETTIAATTQNAAG